VAVTIPSKRLLVVALRGAHAAPGLTVGDSFPLRSKGVPYERASEFSFHARQPRIGGQDAPFQEQLARGLDVSRHLARMPLASRHESRAKNPRLQ